MSGKRRVNYNTAAQLETRAAAHVRPVAAPSHQPLVGSQVYRGAQSNCRTYTLGARTSALSMRGHAAGYAAVRLLMTVAQRSLITLPMTLD